MVSEPVADVFGGAGFVAAEEELAVAVAGDGFPVIPIEALALADGLEDDAAADASASYGGDEPYEVGYFADVGEFVEHAVHVAVEHAVGFGVGFAYECFEEALVEDAGDEGERGVGVGQFEVDDPFALVKGFEPDVVAVEDPAHFAHLEGCEVDAGGDDDAFLGFAGAFEERVVLGACERESVEHALGFLVVVVGMFAHAVDFGLCFGEERVDDVFLVFVLFAGSHAVEGVGDLVEGGVVFGVVGPCDEGA